MTVPRPAGSRTGREVDRLRDLHMVAGSFLSHSPQPVSMSCSMLLDWERSSLLSCIPQPISVGTCGAWTSGTRQGSGHTGPQLPFVNLAMLLFLPRAAGMTEWVG